MNETYNGGSLITGTYNPYTGAGFTYASGGAAVAAAGGVWYQSPIFWLVVLVGAVVIARR